MKVQERLGSYLPNIGVIYQIYWIFKKNQILQLKNSMNEIKNM